MNLIPHPSQTKWAKRAAAAAADDRDGWLAEGPGDTAVANNGDGSFGEGEEAGGLEVGPPETF